MAKLRTEWPRFAPDGWHGMIPDTVALTPKNAARRSWMPREVCGLFWRDSLEPSEGMMFLEIPNVAKDPTHRFEMNGNLLARVAETAPPPAGIWHTHPPRARDDHASTGPRPSSVDLDYHPIHLEMIIFFEGVGRSYDTSGRHLETWE